MSKQTIRDAAVKMFFDRLPQRKQNGGPLDDKAFRKGILLDLDELSGNASGASHYNYAFKQAKQTHPELVVNLGRPPEKNNGGRKKKSVAEAVVGAPVSPDSDLTLEHGDPQQVFEVKRCKDGEIVAQGLSFEDAKALVAKHVAQKKAKLYWV